MKRSFQIFAMLVSALLAGGPALAAAACTISRMAMATSCPMGMDEMGADCQMSHSLATMDCSQDCCNRAQSQGVVIPGSPVKPKTVTVVTHFAGLIALTTSKTISTPQPAPVHGSDSLPRYVLLRVFRI